MNPGDLGYQIAAVGAQALVLMFAGLVACVTLAGVGMGIVKAIGLFRVFVHGGFGYSESSLKRYDEWRHGK